MRRPGSNRRSLAALKYSKNYVLCQMATTLDIASTILWKVAIIALDVKEKRAGTLEATQTRQQFLVEYL